jgi:hypothetical protein
MAADCCGVGHWQAMIEMLPDDVLLEIFDFYLDRRKTYTGVETSINGIR